MSKFGEIFISANDVDVVIEWRIPSSPPSGHCSGFSSPDFSFGGHTWYLHIPYGWSQTYGFCDLLLWKDSSSSSVRQAFSLSLKTMTGEIENERHCSKLFGESYPENYHESLQFFQGSVFCRMRPDDVLTVVCTMKNTTSAGSASKSV